MATQAIQFETVPGRYGDLGLITLQRPEALNALTLTMINAMHQHLDFWQASATIKAVVIRSTDPKAFCAGGDIRKLYEAGRHDSAAASHFFWQEYRLNYKIHQYPKPYISLLNGITMGGGVGISLHGSHAIASDHFSFAMPETALGFFPDIGSSYLLNRCPGFSGTYLGLTGAKIKQADAFALGLIKYCLDSQQQLMFLNELCDTNLAAHPHLSVTQLINRYQQAPPAGVLAEHQTQIDAVFNAPTLASLLEQLTRQNTRWDHQILQQLQAKSPTSLQLTLALLQQTRGKTLAECLCLDYRLAQRLLQQSDFYEGVRALLVDKDQQPRFQAAAADATIADYFAPLATELAF